MDELSARPGGDAYVMLVSDATGERARAPFVVGERGGVQRLDFGAAPTNSTAQVLLGNWEMANLGGTGFPTNTLNANGLPLWKNYVAGLAPNDPQSSFRVSVTMRAAAAKPRPFRPTTSSRWAQGGFSAGA
jgi:hypothetical protein